MSAATDSVPPVGKGMKLSLYDEHRKPHIAITDNTEVVISPRSLNSELCCPICLDLLKTTMTTKECLHRFCHDCITTALMRGNKECPTCRKKLVSKRSLRQDPNFDALIAKIYPDRDEYEAIQERALQRFNRQFNNQVLQRTIEQGMNEQAATRRQRVAGSYDYEKRTRKKKTAQPVPSHSDRDSSPERAGSEVSQSAASAANINDGAAAAGTSSSEIELILKPSEHLAHRENVNQTRYLKTCLNASVEHLCKYLCIRSQLDHLPTTTNASTNEPIHTSIDDENGERAPAQPLTLAEVAHDSPALTFKVAVANQGDMNQLIDLSPDLTLAEVRLKHWPLKRPLELVFDATEPSTNSSGKPEPMIM